MVPVFVHPIPTQQHVLAALDTLGFMIRQAGLLAGRAAGGGAHPAVAPALGYWVAPLYAGPITELEVIFVTNSAGLEAILWMDRRLALAGITHQSISRFRVWHAGRRPAGLGRHGGRLDPPGDQPARRGGRRTPTGPRRSAGPPHVSRHPDEPVRPGYGLGGTAGGAGVGGGGRRRRRHLTPALCRRNAVDGAPRADRRR